MILACCASQTSKDHPSPSHPAQLFLPSLTAGVRGLRRPKRSFTDRDICKAYLCGFCPEEEFARTKYELGTCQYVHDEKCKEQVMLPPPCQSAHLCLIAKQALPRMMPGAALSHSV